MSKKDERHVLFNAGAPEWTSTDSITQASIFYQNSGIKETEDGWLEIVNRQRKMSAASNRSPSGEELSQSSACERENQDERFSRRRFSTNSIRDTNSQRKSSNGIWKCHSVGSANFQNFNECLIRSRELRNVNEDTHSFDFATVSYGDSIEK